MTNASKSFSTMSRTQQVLHIYLLLLLIIIVLGYVFILEKLRASWESRRGTCNGWGLRVDMAESGDSYGRLPECRMAVLHPEVRVTVIRRERMR